MFGGVTGLCYLRARYYSPGIGRFTQADSCHGDGMNLYVYAGNNPVKYVDPSGFCKCGVEKDNNQESEGAPEPEVQKFIEKFRQKYPERKYKSGHKRIHSDGREIEIDFETDNAIIEFKKGNGSGLKRQVLDRLDSSINPYRKVVIGVPGHKMSRFAKRDVENVKKLMSNDIELILELIMPD